MDRLFARLDRTSTWDEVRSALSISSQVILVVGGSGDLHEADTDLGRASSNHLEGGMWLAIVREMPNSKSN